MDLRSSARLLLVATALGASFGNALAQNYPTRPVRLIVGFPPGGVVDITGRTIGQKLAERVGKPVIIDNRPGAGGNIAADLVVKANPDGHTLLISAVSSLAISASVYENLQYDVLKDLAPVGTVSSVPNILVVNPSVPARTVKELIALARSKPGELKFGSAGVGTTVHFAGELFKVLAQADMLHVPYKGAAPAMIDLLGGRVDLMFDFLSPALPRVQAGALRALGVTSARRSPLLPDVPTIAEAGVPGYEVLGSFGVFAPAATPPAIIAKLNADLEAIVQLPEVKEQLSQQGGTPVTQSPRQLSATLKTEVAKWAKIVQASGARQR